MSIDRGESGAPPTPEQKRRAALGPRGSASRRVDPPGRAVGAADGRNGGTAGDPNGNSAALAAIRSGRVGGLSANVRDQAQARAAAALAPPISPRMVLAIDATASRQSAWDGARAVTDSLFTAVPGGLEVALAAHGGGRMTLFTPFHADANALRDDAASVSCAAGNTRMLDILARARDFSGVRMVVYIGDNYEEDGMAGLAQADALRARGIRLVVLHDAISAKPDARGAFEAMAARAGGCVLPFDAQSPERLRDLLASLAAMAAGGRELLKLRGRRSPSARLLLELMPR